MRISKATRQALDAALALDKVVGRFPETDLWMSYDREADVLYISFARPQNATDTIEFDTERSDGILLRYRGKKLVGITILDASTR